MNELRVLFARSGNALTYRLVTSWGGDAGEPGLFVPFLSDDDYEDLRWYLEDYMDLAIGGAEIRARRVERSLAEWGEKLFSAVFASGGHRELFTMLVDAGPPRLLTVGSTDLNVLQLPWELMADDRGPVTRQGVTIRRQLEAARAPEVREATPLPLRILLVVSRPDDAPFIDPRSTTRAMFDALAPLGDRADVDFCRPASLRVLERMLGEAERAGRPYHLVHFDGHGTFRPMLQSGALVFEQESAGVTLSHEVRADEVGTLLARFRVLLVILEACRSGRVGSLGAFRGVAQALVEAGVGSVLAMSHAVHVEATRILLARFYGEVVGGASVGQAVEAGRAALAAKPERWLQRGPDAPGVALQDWFLPQLYQHGADTVLVPNGAGPARRPATEVRPTPAQGMEAAFPGAPRCGFVGRAHELHKLERRFRHHRAVVLHAFGGMGKTSLAREAAFWWTRTGLFPDGACFVDFEHAGRAEQAVRALGVYFEGVGFEKRPVEEQRRVAKELFQTNRVLVVWDNFESVLPAFQEGETVAPRPEEERAEIDALFRAWTEDEKGLGRLLVTCRPGETGLAGARDVELGGLAWADALSMLYGVMQKAGVARSHQRERLVELLEAVGRHPLSIELVGPHLKEMGPKEIVQDLRGMLGELEGEAEVERNRSLRASIGFSLKRLSEGAREAVRWLGLFRGGVFEEVLLEVSGMDPAAWVEARRELEATALVVRVARAIHADGMPYLRFHPTLAMAAGDGAAEPGVRQRYVEVYLRLWAEIEKALDGSVPSRGMDAMALEEANFRKAVVWALEQGARDRATHMGNTFWDYLARSGRLRERDRWAVWLAGEVRKGGFEAATASLEMEEAWAWLNQGEPRRCIEKLESLVARLRTSGLDAAFALAHAGGMLGRAYNAVGWAPKAVPVLRAAVGQWEALLDRAQAAGGNAPDERVNLAASLLDLANALRKSGALDEALAAAERCVALGGERGDYRGVAAGLTATAQILEMQGRHADADARYGDALEIVQHARDQELEGHVLAEQGSLAHTRGQYDRAARLCQRALQLAQNMKDEAGIMRLCHLLGMVEQNVGRLDEARAWFQRSREIAEHRADHAQLGAVAHNLGINCQREGEGARKEGDEARAVERFTEAARFIREGLDVWRETRNQPNELASHVQLASILLLLGDLDEAEEHANHALEIDERLGIEKGHLAHDVLAAIARARNDPAGASVWGRKRDALRADLHRRAGAPVLPPQTLHDITQLALACALAAFRCIPLGPMDEESLARLATYPAPYDALAPFFRDLAAGDYRPLPPSLPREIAVPLTDILEAARGASAEIYGPPSPQKLPGQTRLEENAREETWPTRGPSLGILFDIEHLGENELEQMSYGDQARQIFVMHLGASFKGPALLWHGDTQATLDGRENRYCIAMTAKDPGVLARLRERFSRVDAKGLAPRASRFLEQPIPGEPLPLWLALDETGTFCLPSPVVMDDVVLLVEFGRRFCLPGASLLDRIHDGSIRKDQLDQDRREKIREKILMEVDLDFPGVAATLQRLATEYLDDGDGDSHRLCMARLQEMQGWPRERILRRIDAPAIDAALRYLEEHGHNLVVGEASSAGTLEPWGGEETGGGVRGAAGAPGEAAAVGEKVMGKWERLRTGGVERLLREARQLCQEERYTEALRVAEKAAEGARELEDLGLEIRAQCAEADPLRLLGDFGGALTRYRWILGIVDNPARCHDLERAEVERQVAVAYYFFTETAMFLPTIQTDELFAVLEAGADYVRRIGRPTWVAGYFYMRAHLLRQLNRTEEAVGAAEEALTLALRDASAPGPTLASYRRLLGDMLRVSGRHDEARVQYQAVVVAADTASYDRKGALYGLARCALLTGDTATARRHAQEAVRLAEGMGDDALAFPLDVLIDVCRADGDLPAAHEVVERALRGARRLGATERLYYALLSAANVALDERAAARARVFLDEAEQHAGTLDRQRGGETHREKLRDMRARLAEIEGAAPSERR